MYTIIYLYNVDLLDEYLEELKKDTSLDEFTVKDVQMKLPGTKHKWAGRLIRAKSDLAKLYRKRRNLISEGASKVVSKSPVRISTPIAKKQVEGLDSIIDIDDQIKDQEIAILFLEKAERIFNSMTFDIKNLTEIMKLETQ